MTLNTVSMRGVDGLGLSPGDPCFDPTRPSLLPYWIDDFQEAECATNTTNWLSAGVAEMTSQATGVVGAAASGAASGLSSTLNLPGVLLIGGAALIAFTIFSRR